MSTSKACRFLFAMIIMATMFGCKKDASSNSFAGKWKGTYTGTKDNGSWEVTIAADGKVAGNVISTVFTQTFTAAGTVTSDGQLSMTAGTASSGASFTGTLSGTSGSGTWVNNSTSPSFSGNWTGTKQ